MGTAVSEQQSQSAKRRARKKRINVKLRLESLKVDEDVCPVCDGKRFLLGDPCPLCEESSGDENDDAHLHGYRRAPFRWQGNSKFFKMFHHIMVIEVDTHQQKHFCIGLAIGYF